MWIAQMPGRCDDDDEEEDAIMDIVMVDACDALHATMLCPDFHPHLQLHAYHDDAINDV